MPLPNLMHPVPVEVEQLSRASTEYDEDLREPRGDADRSVKFTIPGQIKWFDHERFRPSQAGPESDSDGYVLFRLKDLRKSGINRIKMGDRYVAFGRGANKVDVDLYVNHLRYMGHYPDQGGATMVRGYFQDRQPSKQRTNPVVSLGEQTVWLGSENGRVYAFLSSQLAASGTVAASTALVLDGAPASFDFDTDGFLWAFGGEGKAWLRGYQAESYKKSGSPVADLIIATPMDFPRKAFFNASNLWTLDGAPGALGRYLPAQLDVSSDVDVIPSIFITLAVGAVAPNSDLVDFAIDGSGWGYLAHRRIGASGGRRIWALGPGQLSGSATGLVPTAENVGTNFDGNPNGVAVASDGKIWVSMFDSSHILAFNAAGLQAGGNPIPVIDITATDIVGPGALKFDASGDLWIVSRTNSRLVRIAAAELVSSGAKTPSLSMLLTSPTNPLGLVLV